MSESALPDLTTEDLIRWHEKQAAELDVCAQSPAVQKRLDMLRACEREAYLHRLTAERLRSERPAVTPEMVEALQALGRIQSDHAEFSEPEEGCHICDDFAKVRAALSVSSTEGKP